MDPEQQAAFSNLTFFRHYDINIRWSITQLFFVMHSAILSLVTTQFQRGTLSYFIACLVGGLFGFLWLIMTDRITSWIEHWTMHMANMERRNRPENRIFGADFASMRFGVRTHRILYVLIVAFTLVWFLLMVLSIPPFHRL